MPNASTNLDLQAFFANVLAPIPDTEEQADTPQFRKLIKKDMELAWWKGREALRKIDTLRKAELIKSWNSAEATRLLKEWREGVLRQCLLPAPTERELRWKKKETSWRYPGGLPPAAAKAIAADEKRLAGGAA